MPAWECLNEWIGSLLGTMPLHAALRMVATMMDMIQSDSQLKG